MMDRIYLLTKEVATNQSEIANYKKTIVSLYHRILVRMKFIYNVLYSFPIFRNFLNVLLIITLLIIFRIMKNPSKNWRRKTKRFLD